MEQAGKLLNISSHTVKKYLDTYTPFKVFYFFRTKQEDVDLDLDLVKSDVVDSDYRKAIWVYRKTKATSPSIRRIMVRLLLFISLLTPGCAWALRYGLESLTKGPHPNSTTKKLVFWWSFSF
jgi:hypothetical protein